jgi:ATP-dependent helicase/DNAse subunit B
MSTHLYISPTLASAFEHFATTSSVVAHRWVLTPIQAVSEALDVLEQEQFQFATLAAYLLKQAGSPITIAPSLYSLRFIQLLLERLADESEIPTLAPVARKRGMIREVSRWIREMETQDVAPDTIAAYDPANPIEQDLARLYQEYRERLARTNLADTDGIVGEAVRLLEAYHLPELADVHLSVIGFDQFEPTPRRFLRALSEQVAQLDIYLAGDPSRPTDALALARLGETYQAIQSDIAPDGETLLPPPLDVPPILRHLQATLFESVYPLPDPETAVRLVAAPSREAEVRTALRDTQRLLQNGVRPSDIAILAPDVSLYQRSVQAVAKEYGIAVRLSQPLLSNPAVAICVELMSLAPRFPRRETMDALRSPYVQHGLTVEELDILDRLTRERPVIATAEQWYAALQPYSHRSERDEEGDEDLGPPPLWQTIASPVMEALRDKLRALFHLLTPPDFETSEGFRQWILTTLPGVDGQAAPSLYIRPTAAGHDTALRDSPALTEFAKSLALLNTTDNPRHRLAWEAYRADLIDLLGESTVDLPTESEGIYVGGLGEGRRRVMPHLFVLGLNEGEFPRLPAPDLFYAPAEREAHPLLRQEFIGDDASLWWQTISNVTQSLTLLRPRLDDKGNGTLASPYWNAVISQIEGVPVHAPRVDESVTWDDAMSQSEQLVAAAGGSVPAMLPVSIQPFWHMAHRAEAIRAGRESKGTRAGVYEGVIESDALLAELQRRYGANRDWSVSQLHRYAECPYGFFAQYVLGLHPITEPQEGLDPRTLGQIYHAILETLYGWMHTIDCLPSPDHQAAILAQVDALCDDHFRTAPNWYQFRPGAMWAQEQKEMRRHLHALLTWECEQNRQHVPMEQERRFGNIAGTYQLILEIEANGEPFRLQGVIDRIDHAADGSGAHIVDYKSGNTTYNDRKIEEGRALQTALYALALEKMGVSVASSRYLLIRKREETGVLEFEESVADHPTVQAALWQVSRFLKAIRAGQFPATPIEPNKAQRACRDGCDLAGVCRVTRHSIGKYVHD